MIHYEGREKGRNNNDTKGDHTEMWYDRRSDRLTDLDLPFTTLGTTGLGHALERNAHSPFLSLPMRVGY